jgi:sugar lactone lactonase YvrE
VAFLLSWACRISAQPLSFTTLAGHSGQGAADGVTTAAGFKSPLGVAGDSAGNVYVADSGNHTIRRVTAAGVVTTVAGLAGVSGSTNGTNSGALFNRPNGVAVDNAGNLYVADTGNHLIRKITPGGGVTTLAGTAGQSGSGNGTGTGAQFYYPEGVAVDAAGNVYVADTWNHAIRKITSAGSVTTFAGLPGTSGTNNAVGTSARFYQPTGVAVDISGNVYVADSGNHTIRKITSGGSVTTLAGAPLIFGSLDGTGTGALFYQPQSVAVDGSGYVYVADFWNQTVRQISPAGAVVTIAGAAGNSGSVDGLNNGARFWGPAAVAVAGTNSVPVYVADSGNGIIRKLAHSGPNWDVSTLAGYASPGSNDGTQTGAQFYSPAGVAVDGAGNTFVADTFNHVIRKITPTGSVTTFAGLPRVSGTSDGTGPAARFSGPQALAVDVSGFVYVADTSNHSIRKITPLGVVSTLAGTAGASGGANGSGANAQFYFPQSVAVDGSGTVFVADTWNHMIRKVTSGGVVSTLAGSVGNYGAADGTNGKARFHYPQGIVADSGGNLYVADSFNHVVRKITAAGSASTIAGLPGVWGNVDGANNTARFFQPAGIGLDAVGNVYVMDAGNHTLRKLSLSGTNWVASTVAGLSGVSGGANGIGTDARFRYPAGLAVDGAGYVYVADSGNNSIRVNRLVPPVLQSTHAGNQASLLWPASANNFSLETSLSLAPSAVWTAVANGIVNSGDASVFTFTANGFSGFYRLHKP